VKDIPLVSVVMPCYNCRQYVGQAISSILEQTYKNLELIIIDDNSTDGSGEIIKRYLRDRDILITHEMNQGVSRSLNDGIRAAHGEFIARMDADDISDPKRIEMQVELMRSDAELVVCGTNVKCIDQDGNLLFHLGYPTKDEEIRSSFPTFFPMSSGAQMWRKTALFQAGLFDERIPGCEDLELTLRLCQVGEAKNIALPLYSYRKNFSSESNTSALAQIERIMLARRAFVLKNLGDPKALAGHYEKFACHYQRTRFRKGQVPKSNKAYYYRNIALINLINHNKDNAKSYLEKAREIEAASPVNNLIGVLIKTPQIFIDSIYSLNRMIRKLLYYIFCGDVGKYLKIPSLKRS